MNSWNDVQNSHNKAQTVNWQPTWTAQHSNFIFISHQSHKASPALSNMVQPHPDMRKGADTRTLSAEVLMDCGNIYSETLNFTLICSKKYK